MRRLTHLMLALALMAGVFATTMQPAEAGRGGRFAAGVAAGIIGLGLLGAYGRARDRHYDYECEPGPERCGWVGRRCWRDYDGYKVCRGGRYTCWRDDYCD